jgi:hypothetical protein
MARHRTLRMRPRGYSLLLVVSIVASACAHGPSARGTSDADVRAAIAAVNAL